MTDRYFIIVLLAFSLLGGLAGCGGAPLEGPPDQAAVEAPAPTRTPDQVLLKESLEGRNLSAAEVADLSDRLLAEGNSALQDEKTLARVEMLILKTLQGPEKTHQAVLWRNLGISRYHQKKYKEARQALQSANELNPRNARTHYYLARLFVYQGQIYEKQGKKKIARQQVKRAAIEMEQARKLEPNNPLYRQDPKTLMQPEP